MIAQGCGAKRIATFLLLPLVIGCGGSAPTNTPTSPTASAPTVSQQQWTRNSDTTSTHIATFLDADGTALDVWEDDTAGTSAIRVRRPNGLITAMSLDSEGRLTYFEDPNGTRAWITGYLDDSTADVTVTNKAGQSWRGVIKLRAPVQTASARLKRPGLSGAAARSLSRDLVAIGNWYCNSTIIDIISAIDDAICLYGALSAPLVPVAGVPAIVGCIVDLAIETLIEEAACSIIKRAAQHALNTPNVVTQPIAVSPQPRPAAPSVPITPSQYDGSWRGTGTATSSLSTAARVDMSFQVTGNRITNTGYLWRIDTRPGTTESSYCGGDSFTGTLSPVPISNRSFQFRQGPAPGATGLQYEITVQGTFVSATSATGTIEFRRVGSGGPAYCGSATIPWTVTK